MYLSVDQVSGHIVRMLKTDPRHLDGSAGKPTVPETPTGSFGQLFARALSQVNDLQSSSKELGLRMITDPDSVNVHDITIAMAEANLSLAIAKSIADGAIRAYREIIRT